jgi:hypothetical protein
VPVRDGDVITLLPAIAGGSAVRGGSPAVAVAGETLR